MCDGDIRVPPFHRYSQLSHHNLCVFFLLALCIHTLQQLININTNGGILLPHKRRLTFFVPCEYFKMQEKNEWKSLTETLKTRRPKKVTAETASSSTTAAATAF